MISVYDALAELPLSSLSYANVLKPLIDLDFRLHTNYSWMDVSKSQNNIETILICLFSVPFQCCPGRRAQGDCQRHQEELGRGTRHLQRHNKFF